jgi:O-antigen/teichoic acid export membrane protein
MSSAPSVERLCSGVVEVDVAPVRSLRSNFSWTLAGNIVYAGTQWGILVVFAKLGSPESVGVFSLGLAITAPIMLFAGLQLRAVQATDARRLVPFADYAGTRTLSTCAAVLLICAIGVAGYRGATAAAIAALALSKGIESLSDIVYGLWQLQERMDLVARSLMLRGGLSLAATTICFVLWHTIWAAVCGMAIAWAGVFAFFDLRRAVGAGGIMLRYRGAAIKHLLWIASPLGIVTLLVSFNGNVPRYMISGMRGIRELGIFSALSYTLVAGSTIVNALGQSAMPRLAAYWAHGRVREFRKLVNRLLGLGLLLGGAGIVVAAVAGGPILKLLYGAEYAKNTGLFVWLMVAAALNYLTSFAGYGLMAARLFRCQLPLFGSTTALMVASCAWLVKAGGARGAAQAMAAVGVVQLLATLALLNSRKTEQSTRVLWEPLS